MNHLDILYHYCMNPCENYIEPFDTYCRTNNLYRTFLSRLFSNGETVLTQCILSMVHESDTTFLCYLLERGCDPNQENRSGLSVLDIIICLHIPTPTKIEWILLCFNYKFKLNPFRDIRKVLVGLYHRPKEERDEIWECIMTHTKTCTWLDLGILYYDIIFNERTIHVYMHTGARTLPDMDGDVWIDYDESLLLYLVSSSNIHLFKILEFKLKLFHIHDYGIRKNILFYFFENVVESCLYPVYISFSENSYDNYDSDDSYSYYKLDEIETKCIEEQLLSWWNYKYNLFQWLVRNGMDVYFGEDDYIVFLLKWYPHPLFTSIRHEFCLMVLSMLPYARYEPQLVEKLILTNDIRLVQEIPWNMVDHANEFCSRSDLTPLDGQDELDTELIAWITKLKNHLNDKEKSR